MRRSKRRLALILSALAVVMMSSPCLFLITVLNNRFSNAGNDPLLQFAGYELPDRAVVTLYEREEGRFRLAFEADRAALGRLTRTSVWPGVEWQIGMPPKEAARRCDFTFEVGDYRYLAEDGRMMVVEAAANRAWFCSWAKG